MKHKALVILDALLKGHTIYHDGRRWCMGEDNSLCIVGRNETKGEDVLLGVWAGQWELKGFVDWCEDFNDEEVDAVASNVALDDLKRGKER